MKLRDESWRSRRQAYPAGAVLPLLYSDVDTLLHVNNVAIARLLEEGRMQLIGELFGLDCALPGSGADPLMMVSVTIEYVGQIFYPGMIEVRSGIDSIGGTSATIAQAAFQNGECLTLARTAVVKTREGRPVPLADAERRSLEKAGVTRGE